MKELENEPILIYDIETRTFGKVDPTKDKLKIFGAYSYLTGKYYVLTEEKDIRLLISKHKYLVGFNTLMYDNVVLYHNGFGEMITINRYGDGKFSRKINIDLLQIFKLRAGSMKIKKGMLGDLLMKYSLDYITKLLDLVDDKDGKIQEFNYDILKKEVWSSQEKRMLYDYTKRDIEITKKLYEWVEEYFKGFKPFLLQKDIENKSYLTATTSVFTYKAICKELGWEEEYQHDVEHTKYGGGYVSYPAGEEFEGNLYCMDYNSLYPHVFAQCNLYSPVSFTEEGWDGNGVFKVKGKYNIKEMGHIESLLMKFYKLRKEYKKNKDPREYSIKIIINTAYGLSGNPAFKHLYNPTTAADCTLLARQWTLLARKIFRENGYEIIYTDTDSVYIKDVFNDKQKMLEVKEKIIKTIKDNVPFPQETFDMGLDDEITHMWFFKGKNKKEEDNDTEFMSDEDDFINKHLGFMKKNYIYLAKVFDKEGNWIDTKVVYKNLGVKKKSTSQLTRKIFRDILIPKIKEEKKVKWPKKFFEDTIKKMLEEDINIIATRYTCNAPETYKNPNQLQAQIARKYGSGIHFLIKNKKLGIGKGSKYCSIEEFKENNLRISDIDLSGVWSELGYFIEEEKTMGLEDFGL